MQVLAGGARRIICQASNLSPVTFPRLGACPSVRPEQVNPQKSSEPSQSAASSPCSKQQLPDAPGYPGGKPRTRREGTPCVGSLQLGNCPCLWIRPVPWSLLCQVFFSLSSENPNLTGKPRIKSLGQYLLTTRPQGLQASNVGFVFTPLWHKSLYGGRER